MAALAGWRLGYRGGKSGSVASIQVINTHTLLFGLVTPWAALPEREAWGPTPQWEEAP